jgi:hypothetical protein
MRVVGMIVASAVVAGCSADRPRNPSFPVAMTDAKAILLEMEQDPKPLQRPLVIAGGIHDSGFVSKRLARALRRRVEPPDQVITVTFTGRGTGTFDECRERLIGAVEDAFGPTAGPATVEVDVIGISMGGLVARHAARARDDGGKRLAIRRLFTISSPHRGARLAGLPTLDRRAVDMRTGSAFLAGLDEALPSADYELYCYARLGDFIVGARNAAPAGQHPWWVASPPFSLAHVGAPHDPRIMADILRRLRGEAPLAVLPAAPIGGDADELGANGGFEGSGRPSGS